MLQNAYLVAKTGADTAENEQHFADILPKTGNYAAPTSGSSRSRAQIPPGGPVREAGCRAAAAQIVAGSPDCVFSFGEQD